MHTSSSTSYDGSYSELSVILLCLGGTLRFFLGHEFKYDAGLLISGFAVLSRGSYECVASAGARNRAVVLLRVAFSGSDFILVLFDRDLGVQACFLTEAAPDYPRIRRCELS